MDFSKIRKIGDFLFEISMSYKHGMKVPARIYASEKLLKSMDHAVFEQLTNVSFLPGIVKYSLCMPDGHSGYGFPIGGVAAIDPSTGVISPGGIGFDINCGVRLMATSLTVEEIKPHLSLILKELFRRVPAGVGSEGILSLSAQKLDEAVVQGAQWAVNNGYGEKVDLEYMEENGCMQGADPRAVSQRARERGKSQVGSLGSGNHYLEIQYVRKGDVYDRETAADFGIMKDDQVVIMIHTGSRGYGHEIASDYLKSFSQVAKSKFGLSLPDRELACAPLDSREGHSYFSAMNCAINFAFLNRQVIMHRVREVLCEVFHRNPAELGLGLVYDVCHNTAKMEEHEIDGRLKTLLVHRKGATRCFGPFMKGLPKKYSRSGQPVLIGGSMESGSYIFAGNAESRESFYSTVHGSGRVMSRHEAKKTFNGKEIQKTMQGNGILVMTSSLSGLAEEAGGAYKDIDEIAAASGSAGLGRPVAKLRPLGNIKG